MRSTILYFLTGIALAVCPLSALAQSTAKASVASIPEGFLAFHLPATAAGQNSSTRFSIPLANDPIYSGVVASVDDDTITSADSPAPWTAGAFATPSTPYFVKFMSGAEMGRVIMVTSNTANTVTLDTTDNTSQTVSLLASGFSVQAGDAYEIFAGFTLASMFGDNSAQNPLVLNGGPVPFQADTVNIYSRALLTTKSYYFNNVDGCWEISGSSLNANNTVFYPNTDMMITRRASEPALTVVVAGRVAEVPVLIKTTGNNSVGCGSTGYATDMTLSQIQFNSNWSKGSLSFLADTISVWNQTLLQFDTYYQMPDSTWRNPNNPAADQSNFVIAAGNQIAILKRGTVSGASSYLQLPMPYSIN